MDYYNYHRRKSSIVQIGNTPLGGEYPVRIQSMTNTSTLDTAASVDQCIRIIQAGADYVRLTAQGVREAENLGEIKRELIARGYTTPLVADIHFNPKAADAAAYTVDKVRINPGNFVDSARTFKQLSYTDEEYTAELQKLKERFIPFLNICKEQHTAIRLGVNHGSLSDRIMSRYGDTPEGMVESCMEFLRICRSENFDNVVISIKASNTVVMVRTVRLLIETMESEGMNYPLHLGVTEAGDGEDGRIKSAVGIGTLLADGIGDTIRVSLSEAPEAEIPVACKLVNYITARTGHKPITAPDVSLEQMAARERESCNCIGGNQQPVVIAEGVPQTGTRADFYYTHDRTVGGDIRSIVDFAHYHGENDSYPLFQMHELSALKSTPATVRFLQADAADLSEEIIGELSHESGIVLILSSRHTNPVGDLRAALARLTAANCKLPVVFMVEYGEKEIEDLQVKAGADFGPFLLDNLIDGIFLRNNGNISSQRLTDYMFTILQAARKRFSKTEYISCPSCGRTMFDLQTTIARVKAATSHLTGLKIGIMGCIVNGPGEMADADYGYVGAGRDKVSLYKGKECIEKNIPEEMAIEKLIALIKAHGDWSDPS